MISSVALLFLLGTKGHQVFGWISEKKLQHDCPVATTTSEDCLARMRAMGHYWTYMGYYTDNPELRRAQYWYGIAANKGDAEAMFHLAWTTQELALNSAPVRSFKQVAEDLNNHKEPESDEMFENVIHWYKKSAEKGFAPAMNNLAVLYKGGAGGHEPNQDLAYKWWADSATVGNPMATIAMYTIYKTGDGVEVDTFHADNWKSWDPKHANPRDLLSPTLERTSLKNMYPEPDLCQKIRDAAKEGKPTILQEISGDGTPTGSSFEEIRDKLQEQQSNQQ